MAKVIPFKAMHYNTDVVGGLKAVVTPPYDIISSAQQQAFYDEHPFNVIRLEYGKEEAGDTSENNKYTRAGTALDEWLESGVLKFEDRNTFYIYGQNFVLEDGIKRTCKGIIGLVRIEEFEKNIVLPHEETLSKAKTDRFNLMQATDCNFSCIYALYMDQESLVTPMVKELSRGQADINFTCDDGIEQSLWMVQDEETCKKITQGFADKQLFIADGHHRYETALNYRNKMREENPDYTGKELYNYMMMFLMDIADDGLAVFPTHRMLRDLPGFDEVQVLDALSDNFTIEKVTAQDDVAKDIARNLEIRGQNDKIFAMYTGKEYYYTLTLKSMDAQTQALPGKSKSYCALDVSILHTLILDRVFGIDSDNMKNQTNLVYTRDPKEAENSVKNGDFQCSFFLNPTKISEISEVSLVGEKMPQKSTYFYPKLVTGIVMNKFQ